MASQHTQAEINEKLQEAQDKIESLVSPTKTAADSAAAAEEFAIAAETAYINANQGAVNANNYAEEARAAVSTMTNGKLILRSKESTAFSIVIDEATDGANIIISRPYNAKGEIQLAGNTLNIQNGNILCGSGYMNFTGTDAVTTINSSMFKMTPLVGGDNVVPLIEMSKDSTGISYIKLNGDKVAVEGKSPTVIDLDTVDITTPYILRHGYIYKLKNNTSGNDYSQLSINTGATVELHYFITTAPTGSTVWPESWIWIDDNKPDFAGADNTNYCIVVRNDGENNIANLAYSYTVPEPVTT